MGSLAGLLAASSLGLAVALGPLRALAAPPLPAAAEKPAAPLLVLPALIADGASVRPPRPEDGALRALAKRLDELLADTARDLGLTVTQPVGEARPARPTRLGPEADLIDRARAARGMVLLPTLRSLGGEVELRLSLASPDAAAVDSRTARFDPSDLEARAVVLLRDLVARGAHGGGASPSPSPPAAPEGPPRSKAGRITLLANTAAFGAVAGYSVERASGGNDPKLIVPLVLVGASIGFGAGIVATGEWNVTPADAWYVSAGLWWPMSASHLIFEGRFSATRPESERWTFGLLGGTVGATMASLGLALGPMSDGGAITAHSGGALGLFFGGAIQVMASGDARTIPATGMGYGSALGWLGAAAFATQVDLGPRRALAIDAGVVLGGLAFGGAASPLLLTHDGKRDPGRERAWAGVAFGGGLVAGTLAGVLVKPSKEPTKLAGLPLLGVLGESAVGARREPFIGAGWSGAW